MAEKRVLIVDDQEMVRTVLAQIVKLEGFESMEAKDGPDALTAARTHEPDIVLLDIGLPGMNGFEVLRELKESDRTNHIPVVIITGEDSKRYRLEALELGADEFLPKPPPEEELRARLRTLAKVKAYHDHMRDNQARLEREVERRTRELRATQERLKRSWLDTVYTLSRAAEFKDKTTASHLRRVSNIAAALARAAGFDEERIEALLYATPMHDIGKIGIPDNILLKPGKLTPDEWEIMKQHTVRGGNILAGASSTIMRTGRSIALTHHERWDGGGYPYGLSGKQIPSEGRITALADVFDGLTSERPYKEAFSLEHSFEAIREGRGTQFDPALTDIFLSIRDEVAEIRERFQQDDDSTPLSILGALPEQQPV
jgi:putative two-component system response regulator